MFSVEHFFDHSVITVMDDSGEHQDLKVFISEDGVSLEQYQDVHEFEIYDEIRLTEKMFAELMQAYHTPEGFYRTKI